jgi:hypothetical protein
LAFTLEGVGANSDDRKGVGSGRGRDGILGNSGGLIGQRTLCPDDHRADRIFYRAGDTAGVNAGLSEGTAAEEDREGGAGDDQEDSDISRQFSRQVWRWGGGLLAKCFIHPLHL